MNQDWLDQYKGVEYLKNKKERDWKFIIGMIVLLAIFAVMGGAFWNMVGKQAQMVREEEQKEEANAISAIYIETGTMELFSAQTYRQRAFTIKKEN